MSSTEELTADRTPPTSSRPPANMSGSSSNARPAGLTQRTSTWRTQASLQGRSNIERQPTVPLDRMGSSATLGDTGSTRQANRQQTAEGSVREQQSNLQQQQTEKKTEDRFYVDNDYYSLNPWYERDPPRPLFGLGRPFPRTVRPGMLRGRKQGEDRDDRDQGKDQGEDQGEVQKGQFQRTRQSRVSKTFGDYVWSNQNVKADTQGPPVLRIPPRIDEHGEHHLPPDRFEAEIDGRLFIVTRADEANRADSFERGVGREDQYKENQPNPDSHFGLQSPTLMPDSMGDNFHGDHPPLEDTQSSHTADTAETQAEKKDNRDREKQAIQNYYNTYRNPLARLRARYPEAFAEFLATTIYLFFGIAGTLYSITYPAAEGDYITQSWAWGLAVTAGIYVGGGISGSHMNPWISVAFSVFRGFPWKLCLMYVCAQILAGFAAGALAWAIYRDAIIHIDPQLTPSMTGKAFYTIPQDYISVATAFFNNFLSAALYTCVAFAIGDDSNTPPGSGMSALIYGLMSFLLCICFGYNGLGVSPARDLGPRFIAWWVGYGTETFSSGWWAYGPIAAGLSGALTGAFVYDVFVFVGNESPLNYNWPNPKEMRDRIKAKRKQSEEKTDKLDV